MLDKEKMPKSEIIALAVMEAVCVLATMLIFWIVDLSGVIEYTFSYKVVTGAILGAAVSVVNFIVLCNAVNRGIDKFLELRGDAEMDEEEAADFAEKNSSVIQAAVQKSMFIRSGSIVVVLVVAFLLGWFDPIATVIPILMYRPLITWGNHILGVIKSMMAKRGKATPEAGSEAIADVSEAKEQEFDATESEEDELDATESEEDEAPVVDDAVAEADDESVAETDSEADLTQDSGDSDSKDITE